MTSNMSAVSAISSVMAVEGVSGEIATPAFIFFSWIAWMRDRGSAVVTCQLQTYMVAGDLKKMITCGFQVEGIEGTSCLRDVVYPLQSASDIIGEAWHGRYTPSRAVRPSYGSP
ncbi:hypothetical protein PHLCEN_2v8798 [Hermanssonia centrifuga]|uniref:Uncharacterized protein n=1 Tax=Hermanssonia centrifuga TaxID=98765 RepID=A0A2R6NSI6_9APHY|nr:hypothetical protein PHLCEN_2v8798 [Hermanssonia centrifuga]